MARSDPCHRPLLRTPSTTMSTPPPTGWYPDPMNPSAQRFWDGHQWTEQTRPVGSTRMPAPSMPPAYAMTTSGSKKTTAGILALILGGFGIHKFYLGYTGAGILQIVITLVTCGIGSVIGLAEGVIYLTKSDEDFVATYQHNKKPWF